MEELEEAVELEEQGIKLKHRGLGASRTRVRDLVQTITCSLSSTRRPMMIGTALSI